MAKSSSTVQLILHPHYDTEHRAMLMAKRNEVLHYRKQEICHQPNGWQSLCRPLADGKAVVHDFIGKGSLYHQL